MTWRYDEYAFFNFSRMLMKVGVRFCLHVDFKPCEQICSLQP